MSQTLKEVFVLGIGLVVGFFWHLFNAVSAQINEAHNIIIGLTIIVGFLVRYLMLMRTRKGDDPRQINLQFFAELSIFLLGLVFGLFWHLYYEKTRNLEVHAIILLLILIFALARYLVLLRPRDADPSD